jgi:hypothetical protein
MISTSLHQALLEFGHIHGLLPQSSTLYCISLNTEHSCGTLVHTALLLASIHDMRIITSSFP